MHTDYPTKNDVASPPKALKSKTRSQRAEWKSLNGEAVVGGPGLPKPSDHHCLSRHKHCSAAPVVVSQRRHSSSPIPSPRQEVRQRSTQSPQSAPSACESPAPPKKPQHEECLNTTRRLKKLEGRLITEEQNSIRVLEKVLAFFESMSSKPSSNRKRSSRKGHHHSRATTIPPKIFRPRSNKAVPCSTD